MACSPPSLSESIRGLIQRGTLTPLSSRKKSKEIQARHSTGQCQNVAIIKLSPEDRPCAESGTSRAARQPLDDRVLRASLLPDRGTIPTGPLHTTSASLPSLAELPGNRTVTGTLALNICSLTEVYMPSYQHPRNHNPN